MWCVSRSIGRVLIHLRAAANRKSLRGLLPCELQLNATDHNASRVLITSRGQSTSAISELSNEGYSSGTINLSVPFGQALSPVALRLLSPMCLMTSSHWRYEKTVLRLLPVLATPTTGNAAFLVKHKGGLSSRRDVISQQ